MRCAPVAGFPDGGDLVEDLLVVPGEEGAAVDHHVHLVGAGRDRVLHVGQLDVQAGPAAGERGGDAGHVHAAALQFGRRDVGQVRVHADGGDHRRGRVGGVGALGLGAQRADLARRVLALQRGQVDHRDRGVERPLLGRGLDGPAGQHGRAGLRPHPVHPGQPVQEPSQRGLVCVSAGALIGGSSPSGSFLPVPRNCQCRDGQCRRWTFKGTTALVTGGADGIRRRNRRAARGGRHARVRSPISTIRPVRPTAARIGGSVRPRGSRRRRRRPHGHKHRGPGLAYWSTTPEASKGRASLRRTRRNGDHARST